MSNIWTFTQIEGVNRKTLQLAGYAAPFGRPRKDPVIKETIKSRVQTTRYPGRSGAPTRHAFGADWEDTEIKGRWMTRHLPVGQSASGMADQWSDFMRDERLVEMTWGNVVSYIVFISELELSRESEHEIAWKMHLLVDARTNNVAVERTPVSTSSLRDDCEAVAKTLLAFGNTLQHPSEFDDNALGLFDNLDLIIGKINEGPAALNKLVNQAGDFNTATFGALNSLRAGIAGIKTTVVEAHELVSTMMLDGINFARSAKSDLRGSAWKAAVDEDGYELLFLMAELDSKAESAGRGGTGSKTVTALEQDTWESISSRAIGGPELAGTIRTLNAAAYGDKPIAGHIYLIP